MAAGMVRKTSGRRLHVYGATINLGKQHKPHKGKLEHKGRTHLHAAKMHHLKKGHHKAKHGKAPTYATFADAMKANGLME